MAEIYVAIAVLSLVGAALGWLGMLAFRALFGSDSPWRWGWITRQNPDATDDARLNKLISMLDLVGLTLAAAMLGWHFIIFALPEALLQLFVLPLAAICIIGHAKAIIRHFRPTRQI